MSCCVALGPESLATIRNCSIPSFAHAGRRTLARVRRAQRLYEKVKGTSIHGRHKARVASYDDGDDADDDGDGDDGAEK